MSHSIFLVIKASDFFDPNNHSYIFKPVFRTILPPRSQSKPDRQGSRGCGGNNTSALHKRNSDSPACILISSAACLLGNFELGIFLALYYPFADENDGAFLTTEGSKQPLLMVVVEVCDWKWSWNTEMRAVCLAGLGRVSRYPFCSPNLERSSFSFQIRAKLQNLLKFSKNFILEQLKLKLYAFLNYCP